MMPALHGQVKQMLATARVVLGRTHAAKLLELMNEVRLVVVTAVKGQIRPIRLHGILQSVQHRMKAPDAGEGLRGEADFRPEQLNKPPLALSDFVRQSRHAAMRRTFCELPQGEWNGPAWLATKLQPPAKNRLHHSELVRRGPRGQQSLAQRPGIPVPQFRQRNFLIGDFISRPVEEGKCSTGLEMHYQDGGLALCVDDVEGGMRAGNQRTFAGREMLRAIRLIDSKLIRVEPDNERHAPIWQDSFQRMLRAVVIAQAHYANEAVQRRARVMEVDGHSNRIANRPCA